MYISPVEDITANYKESEAQIEHKYNVPSLMA